MEVGGGAHDLWVRQLYGGQAEEDRVSVVAVLRPLLPPPVRPDVVTGGEHLQQVAGRVLF